MLITNDTDKTINNNSFTKSEKYSKLTIAYTTKNSVASYAIFVVKVYTFLFYL